MGEILIKQLLCQHAQCDHTILTCIPPNKQYDHTSIQLTRHAQEHERNDTHKEKYNSIKISHPRLHVLIPCLETVGPCYNVSTPRPFIRKVSSPTVVLQKPSSSMLGMTTLVCSMTGASKVMSSSSSSALKSGSLTGPAEAPKSWISLWATPL